MKTVKFATDCLYHIYNRGVDGREIFMEDKDYIRFIHSLYEFNDKKFALPYQRIFKKEAFSGITHRQALVNILCFCLMPNHFHLILQQLTDGGITKFMRKLGTGFTMYFNIKYARKGVLFQSQFRAIAIETDSYLLNLSRYIHLNPIELIEPNWKQEGIKNWRAAQSFLRQYRWSSFMDYLDIENFPYLIHKDFIQDYFKDILAYRDFVERFLIKDIGEIKEILLED